MKTGGPPEWYKRHVAHLRLGLRMVFGAKAPPRFCDLMEYERFTLALDKLKRQAHGPELIHVARALVAEYERRGLDRATLCRIAASLFTLRLES